MNRRKPRERYQNGSLTTETRRKGGDVYVFRWRERSPSGITTKRKVILGTKEEFPSRKSVLRRVDMLRRKINDSSTGPSVSTFRQLAEHYCEEELTRKDARTELTRKVYLHHLQNVIMPRWADTCPAHIKPIAVESWLESLPFAPGTKAKTRSVFSTVFKHGMRQGWLETNPIQLVRQSGKRMREPEVLTTREVGAILEQLAEPARTIVLIAVLTGMRRGELFGLKWQDVDFTRESIHVVRSVVDQVEGQPKTSCSRRPLPMTAELRAALLHWRNLAPFPNEADWVFASFNALGRKPLWPDAVLKRHVLPAVKAAGISKQVGWHTFRRTTATLLISSGASVKVSQELMGHSSPVMTLGTYAQAVNEEKRAAQRAIASLLAENASKVQDKAA